MDTRHFISLPYHWYYELPFHFYTNWSVLLSLFVVAIGNCMISTTGSFIYILSIMFHCVNSIEFHWIYEDADRFVVFFIAPTLTLLTLCISHRILSWFCEKISIFLIRVRSSPCSQSNFCQFHKNIVVFYRTLKLCGFHWFRFFVLCEKVKIFLW